ncbi:MAG: murein biosynthesis integral membrane protein MurJ [Acidimicrobiales bacterium]
MTGPGTVDLRRATAWMAAGTAVSRLTGLLRIVALAYALGYHHLADAYNLANTTPNMLHDVVLGGVLSATFIPVFVDRLATRSDREAWRAISAVVSLSAVVLVVMTVVFWLLAPEVIDAFTALGHSGAGAHLARERAVATTLLRWFMPQVALYGLLAIVTSLLNTRRRFAAPMWVPIANNVVTIGVLLWFHALVPSFPSLAGIQAHPGQLVLLGLGTTLGLVLQAALLLPHLRGIGLARLRWRWDPGHEAVRTVLRLGGWTFGFVVANQVALFVVLALAVGAPGTDPVSSYTYAYAFLQLPYAVVAVSVMSAVTPDLSERWATGDVPGFRRRLVGGLRATMALIIPAAVGMFLLARPAVALLLGHGSTSVSGTSVTGAALALFSLGLPGYCAFLYVVRVLQSMQRTRAAFWLYLVENGLNVVLAVALVGPLGVRGLALSLSVGYTAGAAAGLLLLRRWLGSLGGPRTWWPLRRVAAASAVMGAVVLVVSNLSGADQGLGLLARVGGSVVVGGAVYAAVAALLGGRRRGLALWGDLDGTGPEGASPAGPVAPPPAAEWSIGRTGRPVRTRSARTRSARGPSRPALAGRAPGGGPEAAGETSWPVAPGSRIRIVPAPGGADRGPRATPGPGRRPESGDPLDREPDDDPDDGLGEVRWVGGTDTPLRPRPPR